MILRIETLRGCGIFENFSWSSSGLPDLGRHNLVYGWNGTGKSTLSRILRCLERRESPDYANAEIRLVTEAGPVSQDGFAASDLAIRVFNRDFVEETVEGALGPINVFGKTNLDKKKLLDAQVEEERELGRKLADHRRSRDDASGELESFCTDSGRSIKQAIGRGSNAYANYDKRRFKARAEETLDRPSSEHPYVDESGQEVLLSRANATAKDSVKELTGIVCDLAGDLDAVNELRQRTAVGAALRELQDSPATAGWVQEGMRLHAGSESAECLYCGQRIPEGRLVALEAHFNDAVRQLQADIDDKRQHLEEVKRTIETLRFPAANELAEHLVADYRPVVERAEQDRFAVLGALDEMISCLGEKRESVFVPLPAYALPGDTSLEGIESVVAMVKAHNDSVANHVRDVESAQNDFECARVTDMLEMYADKKAAASQAATEYDSAGERRRQLQESIRKLRQDLISHKIPAQQLTADLARYLGHNDLRVEADGEGYRVTRRGEIARALSDGERTAIAVLYFLRAFDDQACSLGETVVVFDDPVSSLDSNALYNAFAFIKERAQSAKQIIVLTHSFSFFRLVRGWYEHLPGPDKKTKRLLMTRVECGDDGRRSSIEPIDPLLMDFNTEYQYLFGRVAAVASGDDRSLANMLPVANIARRVLESFLAFKTPSPGSLHSRLRAVDQDEARRDRIYRFVNLQSHLDAIGDHDEDLTYLSEAPEIMKDLLELIRESDADHYNGMMECLSGRGGVAD